jgi:DNA polymerase I-like protein with 3'-5' exonuclease and polymerase domains
MNVLAVDVESTIYNKGNPYDSRNSLVCYSIATDGDQSAIRVTPGSIQNLQALVDCSDLIVGFNFKFDLHWLVKYGLKINTPVWDVQLAEFILSHQTQ